MATGRSEHPFGNDTHADFIRQLRAGKRRAWRVFEREFTPDIIDRLRALGADQRGMTEEVLGKVLERVWGRLDQYRGENVDQLRGWVDQITRNLFWDELRRLRRDRDRRRINLDESTDTEEGEVCRGECMADVQASPEQAFAVKELCEKVRTALERRLGSSGRQQAITQLLWKGITSPAEIAGILQMSPGAVSVHKNAIFQLARQCLAELESETSGNGRPWR